MSMGIARFCRRRAVSTSDPSYLLSPLVLREETYRSKNIRTVMLYDFVSMNFLHKGDSNRVITDLVFCPFSKRHPRQI